VNQLRWGIIGPGRIAPRIVRALSGSSRGALVAVASRDLERARAFAANFGIGQAYGSYDELLKSPEIDAVYIPLPNHLHDEWTRKAADHGKHILCEKPLTPSAKEAESLDAEFHAGSAVEAIWCGGLSGATAPGRGDDGSGSAALVHGRCDDAGCDDQGDHDHHGSGRPAGRPGGGQAALRRERLCGDPPEPARFHGPRREICHGHLR